MRTEIVPYVRRDAGDFHPVVYKVVAALAAWFVLAAWIFAGQGVTNFLLAIVSAVILVTVGIPTILSLVQRVNRRSAGVADADGSFGNWASHEVHILTGPVKGIVAAVETMLPIAAVAVGMTIFGLVLHFAAR